MEPSKLKAIDLKAIAKFNEIVLNYIKMKRLLKLSAVILCLISFASCVTQKACERKYPATGQTVIKDSVVVQFATTYRDTVIKTFVTVPDTVYYDSVVVTSYPFGYIPKVYAKGRWSEATAWLQTDRLHLRLKEGGGDSVSVRLNKAIIERQVYRELWHKAATKSVSYVKYTPKYTKFFSWFGAACLLLMILYVILKIRSFSKWKIEL